MKYTVNADKVIKYVYPTYCFMILGTQGFLENIIKVTNFAIGGTKIADLDSALTWSKIEYNGENFIAIPATGKKYAVSSDGVSWTYGELNYDEALNDLKVVDGKFVLLGATKIYTSE